MTMAWELDLHIVKTVISKAQIHYVARKLKKLIFNLCLNFVLYAGYSVTLHDLCVIEDCFHYK